MPVFYLDTSALLKRYKTEIGSDVIDEPFRAKAASEAFTSSYYAVLEITSVARRLLKGRALTRGAYNAMMARFLGDAESGLVLQSVNGDVVASANDVAERYALRAGDAIQLAAALAVKEALPGERFVLLASDKDLLQASQAAGIEAIDPESRDSLSALQKVRSGY